jgi:glycosyltransferase involved in cell wall biosynthesis
MRRKWPVIWGIRQCVYDLDDEKAMTRQIIRWGAKLSKMPQLITYNSETSNRQHTALGYSNCNSAVIPNGVDTDVFRTDEAVRRRVRDELKIPSGSFLIGIVGRYHPVKDHETFWRAARGMLEIRPNTYFAAVGTGLTSENSEVVERIRALGISENVRLVGNRSDMPAMYSALDVVTSTSVAEAFPNAILEGMACGRPCVATRVGDVDQIIGNKELTVMPRDPAGIVGSWMRLADCSIARRTQIGEECRRRVQECFSIQNLRQRYIEVYEQMRELG